MNKTEERILHNQVHILGALAIVLQSIGTRQGIDEAVDALLKECNETIRYIESKEQEDISK